MRDTTAGALSGLVSGAIVGGALTLGRDLGLIAQPTLPEVTRDWLEARFHAKSRFGEDGVELIEQLGHFGASAGLGAAYSAIRPLTPLPGVLAGAAFGAGVYVFAIAGVLPELAVTRGEANEAPGVATQRFVTHLAFGAILGVAFDAMRRRKRAKLAAPHPPEPTNPEPAGPLAKAA